MYATDFGLVDVDQRKCREIELDRQQLIALGWIADSSGVEVVSVMASLAPNGLTSIYMDLRGSTASLGEHFGVDLSELGQGPIDVTFSIETFDLDEWASITGGN